MHYNKVIKDGKVDKVVNESVVDGVQYIDEKPIEGSLNPVTSGGVYEAIKESVIPANVDVIKWSDVLAVQGSDYSEFVTRIAADIAAGIAPFVLDDTNGGAVAVLDNLNAAGALFRTSTNCNERDVMFTNYVITDVTVSRTTYTKNLLFKNSSTDYATYDGFVEVKNNRNGRYTYTGANSLDFLADFDNNTDVPSIRFSAVNPPNFAVKIVSTAAADGTVTVYKKENGIYTPLKPSVAGGLTVEAGKTYQLTCVGDCWTLAEFEEPEQVSFALIGGRRYPVVKIGNQYWMTENLDWKFSDLDIGETTPSDSNPQANYYGDDESTYGVNGNKYGLLYNFPAVERLADLLQDGWRVPTVTDWNELITSVGGDSTAGTKLKSTTGWNYDQNGDGSYGFEAFPAGYLHVSGDSGIFGDIGSYAQFWTSDEFSVTNANALMLTLGASSSPTVYDKNYGCSVRLVKDVQ